ncbi:ParB/RepB/Spo0J family partition protein [Fluviibacterium sp. S390]|uniref:ParB/RepB/Spo0J family partition protein n=1 Tax=Fluviibacterium sp. S390 TaxID=3415139 RepID=UPI003C7EC5EA
MTKKRRRVFDIDMPEEQEKPRPGGPRISSLEPRRGPMASAVRENADSLRDRAETEQAIRAENDALAHEYVSLRNQGLVLQRVPLGEIRTTKLVRDRKSVGAEDLEDLKASIAQIGLSNPIQVEAAGDGFELVQGLRRLTAFRALDAENPDGGYASIPAVVLGQGESLEGLYRRMVDENLVRTDISFAEMAALARSYAESDATTAETTDEAVDALYGSVGKQKRSYIRAFAKLLTVLERHLQHPQAIPRALGLAVRKRIEAEPETLADLQRTLVTGGARDAAGELEILKAYVGQGETGSDPAQDAFPAGNSAPRAGKSPRKARTTFQVQSPRGAAKCTASMGRLELKLDADFTTMDRRKLEAAVQQLLAMLDD